MSDDRQFLQVSAPGADLPSARDGEDQDIWLSDFLSDLKTLQQSIPPHLRDGARFILEVSGDYARAHMRVVYSRPESDEEMADRHAREAYLRDAEKARARAQYERLKAIFELPT